MARDHARVNVTIWNDAKFRALPPDAQALYLTLWTSPSLSYCGVHDWRPCRLAALSGGSTADSIRDTAKVLVERHFLVIDEDTEEVLVRSWMRFDGLMKQPRMAVSCVAAYASIASATIRAVVVAELRRIKVREPELACWSDPRVQDALRQPSITVQELAAGEPIGPGLPLEAPTAAESLGQTEDDVSTPPTPSPTPTSLLPTPISSTPTPADQNGSRRKPARAIPDDWQPNQTHATYATENGIELSSQAFKFRNHAVANDRRQASWDAAFSNWLAKSLEFDPPPKARDPRVPEGWR